MRNARAQVLGAALGAALAWGWVPASEAQDADTTGIAPPPRRPRVAAPT